MHLDTLPLPDAVRLMMEEDRGVPEAVLEATDAIVWTVEKITAAFHALGRLFYAGAGTSGRLGVLDASECPPTFRSPPDQVQGIIAGGRRALWSAVEGAEDDYQAGCAAARERGIRKEDVVIGIAASGRTPFVWGFLHEAKRLGATTVLLCFNPNLEVKEEHQPDKMILINTGPELLTGSTRLKAGTATKLVLNILTTLSMVRIGKVVSNLMVDLNPSNVKLRDRATRLVRELTGCDAAAARQALEKWNWRVKEAAESLRPGE
jgi:N-acetylmuramic acid 6-phosphate etherase